MSKGMIKQTANKVMESVGTLPVSKAMLEVGYSKKTAKANCTRITETKTWKETMEEALPDKLLAEKHIQLLHDEKSEIQIKSLDMAYKLKGSYAPEKSVSLTANLDIETDNPKMKEFKKQTIEKLREIYEQ